LRSQYLFPTVRLALARAARRDPERFRVLQYSVQRDHLHLIVEARDKRSLSIGMQSAAIRVARYVNDLLGRRGALWADRWHGRALKTPREVRNALVYVLANFRKHSAATRERRANTVGIDPYSSGEWFDGWREWNPRSGAPPPFVEPCGSRPFRAHDRKGAMADCSVVRARSWLATVGWRRHGLLRLDEMPRGR
jgi:REP element-mobilizing transposase RayT